MISPTSHSVRWRSHKAVRMSYMSAPASRTTHDPLTTATASTSRWTPARPGRKRDFPTRDVSEGSSSTRRIRTSCWWPQAAGSTRRILTAASSAPPTAARCGRRRSITRWMAARSVRSTSPWIPRTPASCMPRPTTRCAGPGRLVRVAPAARSSSRPMAAPRGGN